MNLSDAVIQAGGLSHSSIPLDVQLRLDLDKDLPLLLVDKGQMQQVAMNLIINAAEAIGKAGAPFGEDGQADRNGPAAGPASEPAPGVRRVCLSGSAGRWHRDGRADHRQDLRLFFTTKFTGRGLGRRQSWARSGSKRGPYRSTASREEEVPSGAVLAAERPLEVNEPAISEDLRGSGTILVVDDEEMIRNFTTSALER